MSACDEIPFLEAYHDTAVFGPHRWMIKGSDDDRISRLQFTSEHDAKAAINTAHAYAELVKRVMRAKVSDALDRIY